MFHITLDHQAFGLDTHHFDGTLMAAKRRATSLQVKAGHGWSVVIRDDAGENIAFRSASSAHWMIF